MGKVFQPHTCEINLICFSRVRGFFSNQVNLNEILLKISLKGFRTVKQTNYYLFPVNRTLLIAVYHGQQSFFFENSLKRLKLFLPFICCSGSDMKLCLMNNCWYGIKPSDNFSCGFVKYLDAALTFM